MSISVSQQFYHLIQKGTQQLGALCSLCDEEKAAIEAHSAEELISIIERKRALLADFADNVNARNQMLAEQGLSPDPKGVSSLLERLAGGERKAVADAWSRLEQALKEAARLNERNEQIVLRSQKNLDQLLRIIRGQDVRTSLYNDAGIKGNYSAQNTLGKA
ncbi:flagella synthesis protein FlgN [Motiliproteus sp. SC1-56]|uniref:flagella synthesis protein FlgN n=1 Tax=Motiliproteus sp. SC1-56 TaxID=2799565 RepID=UPI001A8C27B6|nr:flagellar protein FlgN [Motiliproteus sp. SC1-56]